MRATEEVLLDVARERASQTEKWGEQNPPSIPTTPRSTPERVALYYGIPTARDAKRNTDRRFNLMIGTWADIALEEFCESVEAAALGDVANLRTELVQTAAVLVAWVEYLDRQAAAVPT